MKAWWKEVIPVLIFGILTVNLLLWHKALVLDLSVLLLGLAAICLFCIVLYLIFGIGTRSLTIGRKLADRLAARDKQMFSDAAEPMAVIDSEGIFLSVNSASIDLLGYPADQVLGKHFSELSFISFDQLEKAMYYFQRIKNGHFESFEMELKSRAGQRVIIEIRTNAMHEMGEVIGYQLMLHDITIQRLAEEALKKSEERYRGLFENMLDGQAYCQMIYDKHGKPIDFVYLDVNNQFDVLTGLKNVVGKKVTEIIPGIINTNPEIFEIYGRVANGGTPEKFETNLPQLQRWLSVSVFSPARGYFVAVFNDVSIEKKALADLQAEKSKDDALLQAMGEGMVAVDKEFKVVYVNPVAQKLFEFGDIVGKIWTEVEPLYDDSGVAVQHRPLKIAMETGKIESSSDYYIKRTDGKLTPVLTVASPIITNGEIGGVVALYRDITKEKEIDRAKTEFVSLASHQLRTPLSIINWYTEIMLDKKTSGAMEPEQRKFLLQIYTSAKRMVELVNALLNVSRIEMGTVAVEPIKSDLIKLSDEAIAELAPKVELKKLVLSKDYGKGLTSVSVDPKLYQLILQNLVSNSVKYTPSGGKISVKIANKGDELLVSVGDSGVGIPANLQNQVFTKLFRADNAKAQEPDGTGLGLYVAKSVVEAYGGKIWYESIENKGTTFYFTVPKGGMQKVEGSKSLI